MDNTLVKNRIAENYFLMVLFIMLYMVVLTLQSVDEILKCDHSNESYWAVLSCGAVYYNVYGSSNLYACGWNPSCDHSSEQLSSNFNFTFFSCCRWF